MQNIDKFIDAIYNNKFIEAHEILEESWKKLKQINKDEANIQKGLINGATAIALKLKGKDKGAVMVWNTFEKYRELISTTKSPLLEKYKQAENILDQKFKVYMI